MNYHNRENLPQNGSICVANHTTVIDTVTLSNDRPYALIGQSHGGLLGWFQRRLARCTKVTFINRLNSEKISKNSAEDGTLEQINFKIFH